MNKSIRTLIATTFIGLVAGIMCISILINSQFLTNYYIKYKQSIKKETETFDQNSKRNCNSGKQLSGK